MKRIIQLMLCLVIIGTTFKAVNEVHTDKNKLQLKEIKIQNIHAELDKLESDYQSLELDKSKSLKQKESEIKRLKEREKELEDNLQAKRLLKAQEAKTYAAEQDILLTVQTQPTAPNNASGCDVVQSMLSSKGFSGAELNAAVELAMLESGCRSYASNPESAACNFFQEFPCGKWGGTYNNEAHINGAIGYMQASYGSWQNALSTWHSRNPHWW